MDEKDKHVADLCCTDSVDDAPEEPLDELGSTLGFRGVSFL
jgi:hypothetical protein